MSGGLHEGRVPAGRTRRVTVTFDADALAHVNANAQTVGPGSHRFGVGRSGADIQRSVDVRVHGERFRVANSASTPLSVFDHSFASSDVVYHEASKQNTVDGLSADALVNGVHVRSAGTFDTKKEPCQRSGATRSSSPPARGSDPATARPFAESAMDVWRPFRHVEVSTRGGHVSNLGAHQVAFFGHMPMNKIMPATVQPWVAVRGGQGASPTSR